MADQGRVAHLVGLVRSTVPALHPGGRPIVLGMAAATTVCRAGLRLAGARRTARVVTRLGGAATVGSALFFRDPTRVPPTGQDVVVAPADGMVSLIADAVPPPELGLDPIPRPRISIFLSILDVHVQRIPATGVVTKRVYRAGTFLSADLDKASDDNERNSLVIGAGSGDLVVVTQIAGLLARRIVCDVAEGAQVQAGTTYGLIRFGSRVDTYLPAGTAVQVRPGQRSIGGETVLASLTPGPG